MRKALKLLSLVAVLAVMAGCMTADRRHVDWVSTSLLLVGTLLFTFGAIYLGIRAFDD